jgi:2-oxo-4-hydroxy-4-carboxy-5-ureidoimidazoline decarboxylase
MVSMDDIRTIRIPDLATLNEASAADFSAAIGPLFENAPRFLARLAEARPYASIHGLFDAAREIAHAMPDDEQVELLDAHPRLGAPPSSVSPLSYREQGYNSAIADQDRARLTSQFDRLNAAYETRFGFRYCVHVAGRSRAALLPDMKTALQRGRPVELRRAIDAVVDIARDRYSRLGAGLDG